MVKRWTPHPKTLPVEETAVWYQIDAEYLYRCARGYADSPNNWHSHHLAARVQENAAHSARMARQILGIES